MLISCPACPKMYRVPASAIPPEGREVSCSACGTVWYEKGLDAEVVTVGAGAFTAAAAPRHVHASPPPRASKPKPAPREEGESTVVALWRPKDAVPGWDEEKGSSASPGKEHPHRQQEWVKAAFEPHPFRSAPKQAPPSPEPSVDDDMAAEEMAGFFSGDEKSGMNWAELPRQILAQLTERLSLWRQDRQERSLNQGMDAALKFRDRIRARERNRLTPLRRLGWSVWIMMVAAIGVALSDRELMEAVWPDTTRAYARVFGAPENPAALELKGVSTRYAQSFEGPVLEIRGTVVNAGTIPALPLLELRVDGEVLADYQAVSLSDVTVPVRGERPFVVRAMVPEGTARADIRVTAGVPAPAPEAQGFTLQQTGSGWGRATLPPLPIEAIETAAR